MNRLKYETQSTIEYMIEIPIKISFTWHPEEKMTMSYPGYPAHIDINEWEFPSVERMEKFIEADYENILDHIKENGEW